MTHDTPLDGNAAAGLLASVFPFDMTTAHGVCVNCTAVSALGTLKAYVSAIGTTLYCPHCGHLTLRVAQVGGQYWLDARGLRSLRLPAGEA